MKEKPSAQKNEEEKKKLEVLFLFQII